MMQSERTLEDERYDAIVRRDSAGDRFFFAVRTTGVFCRPTCAARTPLRENVAFFETPQDARNAGFRACKRCLPDRPSAEPLADEIDRACRTIDTSETAPALAELAAQAGVSPFHFQRAFKKRIGITPKRYAMARRDRTFEAGLAERETSVTQTALDAGFPSSAAVYATSRVVKGMLPQTYRSRGEGERIDYDTVRTSLGWLLIAITERGICALELGDDVSTLESALRERFAAASIAAAGAAHRAAIAAAVEVVEGRQHAESIPLDIRGNAFQQRVWQELRLIGLGRTRTYGEIAAAIGAPGSARAVGTAVGANTLAVAVPCHRVVRSDGKSGDYRWGRERKRTLLERERRAIDGPV